MKRKISCGVLPAIVLCGVLPGIVRLSLVNTKLGEYPWFPNQLQWGDFFLYGKMQCFLILAALAVVVLLDAIFIKREKAEMSKEWLFLLGYGLLCSISALLSKDREMSFHGSIEQYESLWVLLGYVVVCFYGYYLSRKKEHIFWIAGTIEFSSLILGILGISQLIGQDLLNTNLVKNLMIPTELSAYRGQVVFNFGMEEIQKVYMTLYNPNYVGVYECLLLPILIGIYLIAERKWFRILCGTNIGIQLLCLLGSGSKSGIVAIGIICMAGIVYLWKNHKAYAIRFLLGICCFMVIWLGYDFCTGNETIQRFVTAFQGSETDSTLQEINPMQDKIEVKWKERIIYLQGKYTDKGFGLFVSDEEGQLMSYRYDSEKNACKIDDKELDGLWVGCYEKNGIPYIFLEYKGLQWLFTNDTENQTYTYITIYGKPDEIKEATSAFTDSWNGLFTYRGYIWGRTIPLLKNYFLWGSGPDTFVVAFPQNDYVARASGTKGFFTEMITKPHNMYLQTAVQTGALSLICLCSFWFYRIGKVFWGRKNQIVEGKLSKEWKMGIAISAGVAAYLIAGMCNDSSLVTAPLFWFLLGFGPGLIEHQSK